MINRLSVTQKLVLSFVFVIIVGSILLSLPISHYANSPETSYLDHLFNTVSMVCVTGLSVVPVSKAYNGLGQILSMLLMQTGGLGLVSLIAFSTYTLKNKLGLSDQDLLQSALSRDNQKDLKAYLFKVYKITFSIEAMAALVIMTDFIPRFGLGHGIFNSLFLAVSAFCNAGFDILGNNSMVPYVGNVWINLVICGLIIAGGLGFVVWIDLRLSLIHYREHFKYFKMKRYLESLSLHTKIALISTFVLIFGGMTVIFILEFQNPLTLKSLPFSQKILASFFQSVTLRTAGFATVDMASLHQATKFFMSIIMFIGGSPAGTAGGVKTVTFVIGLLYVRALMRGDENIHVFKRTIDDQIVKRALTIMLISFAIALTGLFILSISEQAPFIDIVFECVSAFATVGLTAGLTPTLTFVGKIVIIILMYIGRIGPITMVLIFVRKYNAKKGKDVNYIKEHILIG